MNCFKYRSSGFTLVELLIGASLLVVTLSLGMAGFIYFLRATAEGNIQNELDINVQTAMERLKYDIRLSSLDEMFYFPAGGGTIVSISFPMARDDNGDGAVELDANTNIIWDTTLIYHRWNGSPNELRLTIFDPRDNTLTDAERQEQINDVVTSGSGSLTHNGDNSKSTVVFANLFDWSISPNGSIYDGYSSVQERDKSVSLGSIVLSNGIHTLTFKTLPKNSASSGYKIGLDTIHATLCSGEIEAESLLPATSQSGATASAQDMTAQGSWSGNYQLRFPATAIDQSFTVTIANDCWKETNFRGIGSIFNDTKVFFNQALSPKDFVVSLESADWSTGDATWRAHEQTGDLAPVSDSGTLRGAAVRVLMRGEDMINGGYLKYNGQRCYLIFKSGVNNGLTFDAAYIAECADQENPSMDIKPGTGFSLLLFPLSSFSIAGYNYNMYIHKEKSYIISFLVSSTAGKDNIMEYKELIEPTMINSYIISPSPSNAPTVADLVDATWSDKTNVVSSSSLYGLDYLHTWFPTNGQYISQIIDTKQDTPNYTSMSWNQSVPTGGSLTMKVRTGNSKDLSDAQSWTNIVDMVASGNINPGDKRYFQLFANFTPGSGDDTTPLLKDVTVKWDGVERYVDIGGTFTKGPDHGVFKVLVDDKDLKTGVLLNLEIFETARGLAGESKELTSSLSSEVTPRNTGL